MRVALDSNFLVYAEGVNGAEKKQEALKIFRKFNPEDVVIPVQVLGELFNVLVRKARRSRAQAQLAVVGWQDIAFTPDTSVGVLQTAMDLAREHNLGISDSLILSAAAESSCTLLLSEDLQEGFTWAGVTVCNPFSSSPHPLLQSAFSQ
jgi:predicted nucleic acid-binding protein